MNAEAYCTLATRVKGIRAVLSAAIATEPPPAHRNPHFEEVLDLVAAAEDLARLACDDLRQL